MDVTDAFHDPALSGAGWRALGWLGVVGLGVGLIVALWTGGAWSMAAFLGMSLAVMLFDRRLPDVIVVMLVLAAFLNAYGWVFNWFHAVVAYDELVHAYTTGAVVLALALLLWRREMFPARTGAFVLATAALGLALGVAWEIVEMIFINLRPFDTVVDLIMDTLGAAAGGLFGAWVVHRQARRGAHS